MREAYDAIDGETIALEKRKREKESEEEIDRDDEYWEDYTPGRSSRASANTTNQPKTFAARSIFSDVDE